MNGNEFLDKMELIDPAYIEAADTEHPKKQKAWVKWGAMAACLCLVAAGAAAMPKFTKRPPAPIPAPDYSAAPIPDRGEMPEEIHEPVILRPGDEGYVSPMPTPEPAPEVPQYGFVIDGAFEEVELPNVRSMISGYGELQPKAEVAVSAGEACFSEALEAAMEHYGDTVRYRVFIDLYSDGELISSGSEQAMEEAQRLGDLGYIVGIETYTQTEDHGEYVTAVATYYFTLHAEYDQLKNFAADEELGYSLMLYDEGVGISSDSYGVVFSGSVEADK